MTKDKIELHRDYYPLHEAAELAGLKVEDLLHIAANGKLSINCCRRPKIEPGMRVLPM